MKMTLVIDTDDIEGIRAACKMTNTIFEQYCSRNIYYSQERTVKYGKIKLIKVIRNYIKDMNRALESPDREWVQSVDDFLALRNVKRYVDEIFDEDYTTHGDF